jgi:hypothetical protein
MALIRLLERNPNGEIVFREPTSGDVPAYAILSHTWGQEEVLFQDMEANADRSKTVSKAGWRKLWFCANQAAAEGLRYFWVDTCCIDKSNHIELQKAINSMFRWYKNAEKCYVYLPDVSITEHKAGALAFRQSRWFRRGWTLQELLAPASVEFFSQEWKTLGDKQSLTQQIHEATGIPHTALQGAPMFQFSDKERFSWIQSRETKVKEDKAYSLLGIFDVEMPLRYGEGSASAFKRLEEEISKLNGCLQDLRSTDPRDDKRRIEETKGGLLEDSYCWILENSDFRRWRDDPQSRLLWIEGDPGKGKTMLLCGIVKNLKKAKTAHLSYFFCQATDSRINNATAVLRGLLYLLVTQQPSLVSHIQKKYDYAGKALFEDANAWVALSEIFINILQDSSLNSTYLIVDALDECVIDLPKLLDFIVRISSIRSCAKWIVSSRSEAHIEQRLQLNDSGIIRLSLDLKENAAQVSRAVDTYINCCLLKLPEIEHDIHLQDSIREKMQQKANGTFLWVSLAMRELKEAMAWEVLQVLEEVPIELKDLYRRMIQQIKQLRRKYPELCRQVLSTVLATYRPLHLQELYVLSGLPTQVQDVNQATAAIVKMCGSFLTIREDIVYIIHQSARDFLSEASHDLVPSGIGNVHQCIFTRSLQVMSRTLRRDMYSLCAPGYSAKRIKTPDPDPLAASRYPCIYWIDHLCDWNPSPSTDNEVDLQEGGAVESFLKQRYLYWLEALSLCKNMSKGVVSMAKLEIFMQVIYNPIMLHNAYANTI